MIMSSMMINIHTGLQLVEEISTANELKVLALQLDPQSTDN